MEATKKYDVIILGGGLAGLTLALQLKQANSSISILVLEKRKQAAPEATHKVGESMSELGSSYLRERLGLKEYLADHQLPKFGFRFFFSPEHSNDISRRVEVGSRIANPYPTHQIDRGILENDLVDLLIRKSVHVLLGARVIQVAISRDGHLIDFENEGSENHVACKWVVDASGRNGLLKKTLGLSKDSGHKINAAWFRIKSEFDPDHWSEDLNWRNHVDPGRRRLATNHLMGEGYWVWIIPLVSGSTSFGIVADPRYHPFDDFNTHEKAMSWMMRYEPLAARMLGMYADKVLDFKIMKNFAYDCKQFYSADRWALTGEAGAFLDPFYSPGTDFIALGNSWISDLIIRDLGGEDIKLRSMIFDLTHKELLGGWIRLYQDMYGIFGKTQIMLMKIVWDWAAYWAVPCVMAMNEGYTNVSILKQYSSSSESIGRKFGQLNERMQELFRKWSLVDSKLFADRYHNVFDLQCLYQFQTELYVRHNPEDLMKKVQSNLLVLEQIAAEIFRRVSALIHGTPEDMPVDPYTTSFDDGPEILLNKSKHKNALGINASIKADIDRMWLNVAENKSHAYVQ